MSALRTLLDRYSTVTGTVLYCMVECVVRKSRALLARGARDLKSYAVRDRTLDKRVTINPGEFGTQRPRAPSDLWAAGRHRTW